MNKKKFPSYEILLKQNRFLALSKWVEFFVNERRLLGESKSAIISFSGGADSVLLGLLFYDFLKRGVIKKLKYVHFHHGTRDGQDDELLFIQDFSKFYGLDIEFVYLKMKKMAQGNFELEARKKRYAHLESLAKKGDALYLGHHIDDSFEWSLMQLFKSSELHSPSGIPVINGLKRRPLMCLTASQIRLSLKILNIPYVVDPTNNDIRYERNYMRKMIIPQIKLKYPSYLKNYISRQNGLIQKMELKSDWHFEKDLLGGISLERKRGEKEDKKIDMEKVLMALKELSCANRGKFRDQLNKLSLAYQNNKKGPLFFSGGVKVYLDRKRLYFTNKSVEEKYFELDTRLERILNKERKPSQIPFFLFSELLKNQKELLFPRIIFSYGQNIENFFGPSLKTPQLLLPKSTHYLLEKGIWFQKFYRAADYYKSRTKKNETFSFHWLDTPR